MIGGPGVEASLVQNSFGIERILYVPSLIVGGTQLSIGLSRTSDQSMPLLVHHDGALDNVRLSLSGRKKEYRLVGTKRIPHHLVEDITRYVSAVLAEKEPPAINASSFDYLFRN